ncbi:MAG: bifunctional precorrin-2 dehydrogenase/sirohydrochlorin ferrochelatase [Dehalococcoidia bacterium]
MSFLIELLPSVGPALVVGGGSVARRKVGGLLDAGFSVTVVAPRIADDVVALNGIRLVQREFRDDDVEGFALVFACTESRAVNERAGRAARKLGIPVVVADSQSESTFFTPAVHRDGALTVAVSTGGASPGFARDVRDRIRRDLGPGWAERVETARRERRDRSTGMAGD